ncbi:MAG: amidohydrolase [Planctomycetota bacterium]|jgi:aminobenzoyl-glutamate utilization protein B
MNPKAKRKAVNRAVRVQARAAERLLKQVHGFAEPAFRETGSAAAIAAYLAERGFRVEFPWRKIPTAFRAVRGTGRLAIGILGEYDALPNCGKQEGTWGHGCGHDLLGVAAAAGAVAAAELLSRRRRGGGKIVYYGCPAEETLAGKGYMARDGAFRDIDACLCWHPGGKNRVRATGGSALDSLVFEFFGKTAHGAASHRGRSALDGVMLMDVAANYLREHVPENVRMHMVVRDGGDAPNVVPAYAKAWYYVRGKSREQVDEIRERLVKCARGAATATDTRVKWKRIAAVYERCENEAMEKLVGENLGLFGGPRATPADRRRVRRLKVGKEFSSGIDEERDKQGRGSTDEDNVSWLTPLGGFAITCVAAGTTGHHRDYAAQTALPFAVRAMLQAAKVFAGCAIDLVVDKRRLGAAKREFRKKTKGFRYDPLLKKTQRVPIDPP